MVEIITFITFVATSKGIYAYRFDAENGRLEQIGLTGGIPNASFLAVDPGRKFLYSVGTIADHEGKPSGRVTAFAIDLANGTLTQINQQSSEGRGPCHVTVDPSGSFVAVANYSGGSAALFRIEEGGALSPATDAEQFEGASVDAVRQTSPHAHSAYFDADGKYVFIQDLGTDKIWQFRLNANAGKLVPNAPPALEITPGAGPRHFAFHPNGKYGYLINELNNTVTACAYDAQLGTLSAIQEISTLPDGFTETSYCADIHVHPGGKFLYGSNRGHDSIAIFRIDGANGKLQAVGHQSTGGAWPRNFGIDPSGTYLLAANQKSDTIVHFRIDADTGALEATGDVTTVPSPACVIFVQPER